VGAEKPSVIKIPLRTPLLKPGVVQEARLTLNVIAEKEPLATYQKKIWIFPSDPFALKKQMLKELKIKLYDAVEKSNTARVLKELDIPFDELVRPGEISDLQEGVILVGEGISFQDDPELFPALDQAARRGARVLCLAPKPGSFAFPENDQAIPESLVLNKTDIIGSFDKRLDAKSWPPDGTPATNSLVLLAEEGRVRAQIVSHARGWHWLSWTYPEKKGRLSLVTFGLLRCWDASPTARYLLASILESMAPIPDPVKKKE
jgi:hypothetical protein